MGRILDPAHAHLSRAQPAGHALRLDAELREPRRCSPTESPLPERAHEVEASARPPLARQHADHPRPSREPRAEPVRTHESARAQRADERVADPSERSVSGPVQMRPPSPRGAPPPPLTRPRRASSTSTPAPSVARADKRRPATTCSRPYPPPSSRLPCAVSGDRGRCRWVSPCGRRWRRRNRSRSLASSALPERRRVVPRIDATTSRQSVDSVAGSLPRLPPCSSPRSIPSAVSGHSPSASGGSRCGGVRAETRCGCGSSPRRDTAWIRPSWSEVAERQRDVAHRQAGAEQEDVFASDPVLEARPATTGPRA